VSGERSTLAMLMDHIPQCPCSWHGIRTLHVLAEFMLDAGAIEGRDLRLEVRRIRSRVSRDRHGDVVWLDFMAPHPRHTVIFLLMLRLQLLARAPMLLV
jgi:hypothetical protein